uniref:Uncharacterized protein n=1 Tax=Anopheles farauti TaxID=69004 RepID=A0A182QHP4_9DIPT
MFRFTTSLLPCPFFAQTEYDKIAVYSTGTDEIKSSDKGARMTYEKKPPARTMESVPSTKRNRSTKGFLDVVFLASPIPNPDRMVRSLLRDFAAHDFFRELGEAALPEVIQRNCRNCSPQQAQNAQKLTNFLQTRYPEVWAMLIRKYGAV